MSGTPDIEEENARLREELRTEEQTSYALRKEVERLRTELADTKRRAVDDILAKNDAIAKLTEKLRVTDKIAWQNFNNYRNAVDTVTRVQDAVGDTTDYTRQREQAHAEHAFCGPESCACNGQTLLQVHTPTGCHDEVPARPVPDTERRERMAEALGADPLRDWDDLRNAARGIRRENARQRAELEQARATTLAEAADVLWDMHFTDGMSVQEIGTAFRHMATAATDKTAGFGGRPDLCVDPRCPAGSGGRPDLCVDPRCPAGTAHCGPCPGPHRKD